MKPDLPIRVVVFDLDGLMFNTEDLYQEVGAELLRRRGKVWTAELLDAMMGRPSPVALQIMIDWHQLNATVPQLEQETDEVFDGILADKLRTMPGLLELMEWLEDREIPKAVCTSSRRAFVDKVLGQFELHSRFAFLLTSENVTHGKPHPEIYLTAANRFGVSPAEMMVLEDSENGCKAAVAAGTYAIAVPAGHSHNHTFDGAKFVADGLSDSRIYSALQNS